MYSLGSGLSHCIIDGTVVFLDSRRDRYFGLTPTASRRFLALLNQATSAQAANGTDPSQFVKRGLLVETDEDYIPTNPIVTAATREWLPQTPAVRPRPHHQILALAAILTTLVRLRLSSFERAISPRRAGRHSEPPAVLPAHIVEAFLSVLNFLPGRLQCLPASLSLRAYLSFFSIPSELVLAVTLRPFAAHCWIQVGEMLVGDTLERTAPFTPIRYVR